jgi:hypothetical protein
MSDDTNDDPVDEAEVRASEPNYRRTTIIFTAADSTALDDLVKGADQRNWDKPSRSSIVRALVRLASESINSKGELLSTFGEYLDTYLQPHLTNIAQEALKPGPPKGTKPPKRLR